MIATDFIQTYGYLALLIGTFMEGETIVVIGGFAAHRGFLELPFVILFSFLGTLIGDQLFFWIGHKNGKAFLLKRPLWKERVARADRLLERYHTAIILGFRFIYGIRTVTPFVIGMSGVKTVRFLFLNLISALVWAVAVATAGYFLGAALEAVLRDLRRYELAVIVVIAALGSIIWLVHFIKNKPKTSRSG